MEWTLTFFVSVAECCLSLREVIGKEAVMVVRELTHQGHSVGELE